MYTFVVYIRMMYISFVPSPFYHHFVTPFSPPPPLEPQPTRVRVSWAEWTSLHWLVEVHSEPTSDSVCKQANTAGLKSEVPRWLQLMTRCRRMQAVNEMKWNESWWCCCCDLVVSSIIVAVSRQSSSQAKVRDLDNQVVSYEHITSRQVTMNYLQHTQTPSNPNHNTRWTTYNITPSQVVCSVFSSCVRLSVRLSKRLNFESRKQRCTCDGII